FFLDLVLRLVRHCGVDPSTVELRRCLFIAPVVAAGTRDRQVQVAVAGPTAPGVLPVTVRSRPICAGVVLEEAWDTNFTAELRVTELPTPTPLDTRALVDGAEESLDADALYAFARQVDIHHRDFMKVDGTVYRGTDYSLGDVRLGAAAQGYLDHFHIHPVVLDFATLVPFLQFDAAQRHTVRRPFIPIYIESFRAPGGLGPRGMVYVPKVAQRELDAETVTADISICQPDGTVVAALTGFRAKRVRSADLITRLATEHPPPALTVQPDEAVRAAHRTTPAPGQPADGGSAPSGQPDGRQPSLEQTIATLVGVALGDQASTVDLDRGFYDLGLTSVNLLTIAAELEKGLGHELYPTLLFEQPTVRRLAAHLRAEGLGPASDPPAGDPVPTAGRPATASPAEPGDAATPPVAEPATGQAWTATPAAAAAAPAGTVLGPAGPLDRGAATRDGGAATSGGVPVGPASGRWPVAARPIDPDDDIAIVGLAGRYPGAPKVRDFWRLLHDGRDCVTEIPADRWDYRRFFHASRNTPGKTYSRWGAFLDGVADFDPLFFNISPRQAELMDPHERLFLETAWETIEDAGYTPDDLANRVDGSVGVFAGVMWSDYQLHALEEISRGNPQIVASTFSLIANRVSYAFDFRGPSISLDTACSSSLTTLHLAGESIRRGECRAAIAGGVNLSLHPYKYLRLAEHHLLSTDGRCRVFGAGADGYVPGEGVGAVLLRPLSEALADGDQIYGLIRGSALQHGGRTSGFAVPSPEAQGRVVGEALARSGVDVETITYIETHGGATTLGDQIEIAALTKAFRRHTDRTGFCAVGSLKSNVGHLEAAAGIAALTKVLLSLRHRTIVPSLHTDRLNPEIPFAGSPFYVARDRQPWLPVIDRYTGEPAPLRGALSAFGFGGANVHLVVEEYPNPVRTPAAVAGPVVVPLSARDEAALRTMAERLRDFLREHHDLPIAHVAYTL
ncbi:MAG: hypothetical protein QOE03_3293, partial [Micromonosporaceae bacterium]|nr:hypothetical protein [Micromonosporaceae bacterium]